MLTLAIAGFFGPGVRSGLADNDNSAACKGLPSQSAFVSGDSSCADHNIAWRTRHPLSLDYVSSGLSPDTTRKDNIVYDIVTPAGFPIGVSTSGWGHPACSAAATSIAAGLPTTRCGTIIHEADGVRAVRSWYPENTHSL